jgi:hypothetical protein
MKEAASVGEVAVVGSFECGRVCRSFIVLVPILRMFSNPLSGLRFGGETLDYFCLAIRPKNIDHPAKSWIFSRHENGPVFGHLANMRLRGPGSSQNRLSYSKEPTTEIAQYAPCDLTIIVVRAFTERPAPNGLTCTILGQMIQHPHDAALQLSHPNKEGRVRVRKRQWAQLERFFSLN